MDTDITSLKRALAGQVESVCQELLPEGKRVGSEWVHDPGTGKVKVELLGAKAGVWSWFGGDDVGGDLIDLWKWRRGYSQMTEVLKEVRDFLGIKEPAPANESKRRYDKPRVPAYYLDDDVPYPIRWAMEKRCIPRQQLELYGIRSTAEQDGLVFTFYEPCGARDHESVLVKWKPVNANLVAAGNVGPSRPTSKNAKPILFGWTTVTRNDRRVCLVEGELDAPSGAAMLSASSRFTMPVLSVPFGGGAGAKQQWIDNDWEKLAQFETIYLALDNDDEGEAACEEIARRLGYHRCKRVRLPRKDFNECLQASQVIPIEADVITAFIDAEDYGYDQLRRADHYTTSVVDAFYPSDDVQLGYSLPFTKTHGKFLCRLHETTLWSGDTNTGKSQLLSHCIPYWVSCGAVVTVASLEMTPTSSLVRLVKQATGMHEPAETYIERTLEWLSGGSDNGGACWLYDKVGLATVRELLEVFDYAHRRYGADVFIIDSWMRLGVANQDAKVQEKAILEIVDWAANRPVHVHLVAHNRKPHAAQTRQDTHGVKGAQEIAANVHNQMEVVRVKAVEEVADKVAAGLSVSEKELDMLERPPVVLYCNKQRNGDWAKRLGLWFDTETYRFREKREQAPMSVRYIE